MLKKGMGLKVQYQQQENIKYALQELVEKKNTPKDLEFHADRDDIKGEAVKTIVPVKN